MYFWCICGRRWASRPTTLPSWSLSAYCFFSHCVTGAYRVCLGEHWGVCLQVCGQVALSHPHTLTQGRNKWGAGSRVSLLLGPRVNLGPLGADIWAESCGEYILPLRKGTWAMIEPWFCPYSLFIYIIITHWRHGDEQNLWSLPSWSLYSSGARYLIITRMKALS